MNDDLRQADFGRVRVYFGEKSGKYPDGNQVIVHGSDTHAAFDTPLVANRIGADFDQAELVILGHVHEDHMAGLHRLPHAAVHVHQHDLDAARSWPGLARHYGLSPEIREAMRANIEREFFYAPRPDAIGYADGASWDLGGSRVRAIHMPGHTSGHCVLLVEPEGVAFIGDIELSGFGPYYGDASSDLGAFRRTLARLPELPARVWVTSHHRGIYTDRAAFLDALAAYAARIDERSERLLAMLAEAPKSLDQLAAERLIYPLDYEEVWVFGAERRTIAQHLDELIARQRVSVDQAGRFRAA
ncbi:MAG: MBL fold metallo-hydrolase [Burkholderiaceae bacterium]|nr:MBL fold metallo-hydrolase [Burkholderiaceae bacterium]